MRCCNRLTLLHANCEHLFSAPQSVTWNQPWWGYLHHRNQQPENGLLNIWPHIAGVRHFNQSSSDYNPPITSHPAQKKSSNLFNGLESFMHSGPHYFSNFVSSSSSPPFTYAVVTTLVDCSSNTPGKLPTKGQPDNCRQVQIFLRTPPHL